MGFFKKEKDITSNKDLNTLVNDFTSYLKEENWKVESNVEGDKAIIQAQKPGILRDIVAADRALTFVIEKNQSGTLHVSTGVGKKAKNLAITAIEVLLLSEIFIFVDIPEILFAEDIEKNLLKQLEVIAMQ
ncbi:hypothetical protein ACNF42_02060 [Cuniculiplasma sp. SKW3]|uniref:hypothetical protein n=1 Tax=Cuniculiplasma sp. SKW3 TaxID=3400170 RepID=UPI003FCFE19C